ncbi:MAG: ABC transporter permease subunit [Firmicutes bacterium]|nr:ABC transporter permease subunit [Bacillota bacterium]
MQHRITLSSALLPAAAGASAVVLLQTGVIHSLFGFSTLQLPLPSQVVTALGENPGKIWSDTLVTMGPAMTGMALGALLGYGVALFVTMCPGWGYGSMIIMTLINSVPVVALAPLMNRWFETDFFAKLAVIVVASSGAMAVNAFEGLSRPDRDVMELMRISSASKFDIATKVRIPGSLPKVFTSVRILIPVAMLAAIISEFFASKTSGLGYMIKYSLKVGNQKNTGWAYILTVAAISILLYLIVVTLEKRLLRWHVSQK